MSTRYYILCVIVDFFYYHFVIITVVFVFCYCCSSYRHYLYYCCYLQIPFIWVSPAVQLGLTDQWIGNPSFPSFAGFGFMEAVHPLTFGQRALATFGNILFTELITLYTVPRYLVYLSTYSLFEFLLLLLLLFVIGSLTLTLLTRLPSHLSLWGPKWRSPWG